MAEKNGMYAELLEATIKMSTFEKVEEDLNRKFFAVGNLLQGMMAQSGEVDNWDNETTVVLLVEVMYSLLQIRRQLYFIRLDLEKYGSRAKMSSKVIAFKQTEKLALGAFVGNLNDKVIELKKYKIQLDSMQMN